MEEKKIIKELAKAWSHVYGEDMEDEYKGFFQEVTGKYKDKVTKKGTARERKLKQGRDRVNELYMETDWIGNIVYAGQGLLKALPPWGEAKLLKNAWTRGDTQYDVPGVYRYTDTRTGEVIYYGMSVCSIRSRTYKFIRHTRFADSKELTKDGRLRCNEQHSKTWVYKLDRTYKDLMEHVSVEYLPLPIEVASLVESALISNHYTQYNKLPLLNSSF